MAITALQRAIPRQILGPVFGVLDGGAYAPSILGRVTATVLIPGIALDRLERGAGERSAVQEVRETFALPVIAIADLDDLVGFLGARSDLAQQLIEIEHYRQLYGADAHA